MFEHWVAGSAPRCGGKAAREPAPEDSATAGVRAFNRAAHAHPRLQTAIVPADDGLGVSLVLPG